MVTYITDDPVLAIRLAIHVAIMQLKRMTMNDDNDAIEVVYWLQIKL